MFLGFHEHSIDSKGRLVLPARFRAELGPEPVATMGFERCVEIYPASTWREVLERYSRLPSSRKASRDLIRILCSSAVELSVDEQGRVLLPSHLREHAMLEGKVAVIGAGVKVEVWSLEVWRSYREDTYGRLSDILEEVSALEIR